MHIRTIEDIAEVLRRANVEAVADDERLIVKAKGWTFGEAIGFTSVLGGCLSLMIGCIIAAVCWLLHMPYSILWLALGVGMTISLANTAWESISIAQGHRDLIVDISQRLIEIDRKPVNFSDIKGVELDSTHGGPQLRVQLHHSKPLVASGLPLSFDHDNEAIALTRWLGLKINCKVWIYGEQDFQNMGAEPMFGNP